MWRCSVRRVPRPHHPIAPSPHRTTVAPPHHPTFLSLGTIDANDDNEISQQELQQWLEARAPSASSSSPAIVLPPAQGQNAVPLKEKDNRPSSREYLDASYDAASASVVAAQHNLSRPSAPQQVSPQASPSRPSPSKSSFSSPPRAANANANAAVTSPVEAMLTTGSQHTRARSVSPVGRTGGVWVKKQNELNDYLELLTTGGAGTCRWVRYLTLILTLILWNPAPAPASTPDP